MPFVTINIKCHGAEDGDDDSREMEYSITVEVVSPSDRLPVLHADLTETVVKESAFHDPDESVAEVLASRFCELVKAVALVEVASRAAVVVDVSLSMPIEYDRDPWVGVTVTAGPKKALGRSCTALLDAMDSHAVEAWTMMRKFPEHDSRLRSNVSSSSRIINVTMDFHE